MTSLKYIEGTWNDLAAISIQILQIIFTYSWTTDNDSCSRILFNNKDHGTTRSRWSEENKAHQVGQHLAEPTSTWTISPISLSSAYPRTTSNTHQAPKMSVACTWLASWVHWPFLSLCCSRQHRPGFATKASTRFDAILWNPPLLKATT